MVKIGFALLILVALLPLSVFADPVVPPITLDARMEQSTYREGQQVMLALILHNDVAKNLYTASAFEESAFQITVMNEAGQPVPRTALGERVLTPPMAVTANSIGAFLPGQTLSYRFNLARLFDLSRAGFYSVTVSRRFRPWNLPRSATDTPPQEIMLSAGPLKVQLEDANAKSGPVTYTPVPSRQTFLYMATIYSPGVARYRVGADGGASFAYNPRPVGADTAVPPPVLGSGPSSLVTTPDGRFLYAGRPSRDVPSQYIVSQYQIVNDGVLSPLSPPTVTVSVPTPQIPGPLLMDPKGRFLYSLAGAVFAIEPDGCLTLTTTASWDKPLKNGSTVQGYWGVIDPTGTFLYVNGGPGGGFQINVNGSLTPLVPFGARLPTPYHGNENALALSPTGKFAFVGVSQILSNAFFDLLVPMRVEKSGRLTPIQGVEQAVRTPVPPPNYSAPDAAALTVDPTGRFLVVMNPTYLDCYRIEADGRLTFLNMTKKQGGFDSLFFVPHSTLAYTTVSNTLSLLPYRFDDKKGLIPTDLALPTSIPFQASIAAASAPTSLVWGQTVDGLAISTHLPADILPATQPVVLTVTLQNTTAKPLSLGMVGADMAAFHLSVTAPPLPFSAILGDKPESDAVPLLAAGHDLLNTAHKDKTPLILAPGGKRQYRLMLSRLADLSRSGSYTVQVTRTLPNGKTAASPVVPFMLNDPPQATRYAGKEWVLQVP